MRVWGAVVGGWPPTSDLLTEYRSEASGAVAVNPELAILQVPQLAKYPAVRR